MNVNITLTPMIWLLAFIILLVFELVTMGLATVWFAIGALAGLVMNLCGFGFWPQMIAFLVVSFLMLLVTRPMAMKYINKEHKKTNMQALPGKEAVVTEEINNLKGKGRVLLSGLDWRAVTEESGKTIETGTVVEVLRIDGVKVVVAEKEK